MLAEDNLSNGDTITPTWNNITPGNASINTITYYRTGNRMKAQGHIKLGSTSSISGAMGIDIPAGLTVDTSKATNFQSVGVVWGVDSATGRFEGILFVSDSNTLVVSSTDGTNSNWSGTKPFTWTTNDEFYVDFEVPILEWAGSQNSLVGYSLATETQTGLVSTGAQEFGGDKTFNGDLTLNADDDNHGFMLQEAGVDRMSFRPLGSLGATFDFQVSGGSLNVRDDSGNEVFTINETGNIGIGQSSPSQNLDIKEDVNNDCAILVENLNTGSNAHSRLGLRTDGGICYLFKNSTTRTAGGGTDSFTIQNESNGVYLSAGATSWSAVSDMRYKTKVDDFTGGLDKIMGLSTFTYTLNEDESVTKYVHLGMSAQEVLPKIPEVVTGDPEVKMGISYVRFVPVLVNAMQELKAENDELKDKLAALEARLDAAGI